MTEIYINPLNAELNPTCYLLALLGAHHNFHVSGIRLSQSKVRYIDPQKLEMCHRLI
jgi:hypothetical protein